MELTRTKLLETLKNKKNGWTTYQARKIAGISIRRVNQIWKEYLISGKIPEIRNKNGRPKKPIEEWETQMVKETYLKYRVSADTLERVIKRDFQKHIPHNRIHRILLELDFAKSKKKKDIRKKNWIRYERRHSLTAIHIDWHYDGKTWVYGVIDDASRKILALLECGNATTEKSIEGIEEALKQGQIKQCIGDHGTQFTKTIAEGNCRFKEYLDSKGIKQILCRIKHPQSNGKIEKWFEVYDNHRYSFNQKEDFLYWYNEVRPHRSLDFQNLETPNQAFIRKMKSEVI